MSNCTASILNCFALRNCSHAFLTHSVNQRLFNLFNWSHRNAGLYPVKHHSFLVNHQSVLSYSVLSWNVKRTNPFLFLRQLWPFVIMINYFTFYPFLLCLISFSRVFSAPLLQCNSIKLYHLFSVLFFEIAESKRVGGYFLCEQNT